MHDETLKRRRRRRRRNKFPKRYVRCNSENTLCGKKVNSTLLELSLYLFFL